MFSLRATVCIQSQFVTEVRRPLKFSRISPCVLNFICSSVLSSIVLMSLILHVRGPIKASGSFVFIQASKWVSVIEIRDFFSCQTQSLSPCFPSGTGEERRAEKI